MTFSGLQALLALCPQVFQSQFVQAANDLDAARGHAGYAANLGGWPFSPAIPILGVTPSCDSHVGTRRFCADILNISDFRNESWPPFHFMEIYLISVFRSTMNLPFVIS
ncbi:hypothetical protein [Burkholderia ambifaria]|uniref:hypothetical protein n=1 Tax=Burkholderia ambifaria TaxID=152480 RepID=UPI00178AE249|nr:hypothetical protein [Burkholderia ambifaria]MBY4770338.1 hypothetical protein [Burkholderia ambifaria]